MKICIDATPLYKPTGGGIRTYTLNLLKTLPAEDKELEVFLLCSSNSNALSPEIEEIIKPFQKIQLTLDGLSSILAISIQLARELKKREISHFIATRYTSPLFTRDINVIPIIYDLFYRNFNYYLPLRSRILDHITIANSVRRGNPVICISNYTADCVEKSFGISRTHLEVAYAGYDSSVFFQKKDNLFKKELLSRFSARYFIFASDIYNPRKNYISLVKACEKLPVKTKNSLLLVGCGPVRNQKLRDEINAKLESIGMGAQFYHTGNLGLDEMASYYNAADLMYYVTYEEGFGLPILEAMACGTPVICGDSGAAPEVAGDAALKLSPNDPGAIANAIGEILESRDERERLKSAGLERCTHFSWQKFTNQLLSVL